MSDEEQDKVEVVFKGLLAQLAHPVYRMRFVTAQKIAELLSENSVSTYQKEFLKWLSSRVFETEVIVGLSVLGLMEKGKFIDQSLVRSHIKRPSILSDMYLEDIYGAKTHFITWSAQHSGYPSAEFKVPHSFQQTSTSYVAPIFRYDFEYIEETYGPPLVHHWAWEYENLRKLLGKYETSHSYFLEDHDRWEYTGSYHFKISDALQSSYLRTLNFAVSELGMPEGIARDLATNAITLDFELAKVSSNPKPKALDDCDASTFSENTTSEELDDFVSALSSKFDEVLVAASFPLCRSKSYSADLGLMSFITAQKEKVLDAEFFFENQDIHLPKRFNFHDWVKQSAVFEHMKDAVDEDSTYPATFRIMPLRFMRWQQELLVRGLYVPSPILVGDRFEVEYDNQQISFKMGDVTVARWLFWMDNWKPCHLKTLYSGVGAALFVDREIIKQNVQNEGLSLGVAARLNYISRENDYGSFENGTLYSNSIIL